MPLEREREREGRRRGEMEEKWSETFMYYIRSLNLEVKERGKKERKEERKIESRKIEIWWKDLD